VAAVLLVAIAVFGALYVTGTIKLAEASIGTGFVVGVATVAGLAKK
jgi:hypothetical protein